MVTQFRHTCQLLGQKTISLQIQCIIRKSFKKKQMISQRPNIEKIFFMGNGEDIFHQATPKDQPHAQPQAQLFKNLFVYRI